MGQEIVESSRRGKERGREEDIPEAVERAGVGQESSKGEDVGFKEVALGELGLVNL